jgi:hypothetical protein
MSFRVYSQSEREPGEGIAPSPPYDGQDDLFRQLCRRCGLRSLGGRADMIVCGKAVRYAL